MSEDQWIKSVLTPVAHRNDFAVRGGALARNGKRYEVPTMGTELEILQSVNRQWLEVRTA